MFTKRDHVKKRFSKKNASRAFGIKDILRLSAASVGVSLAGAVIISFFAALILFKTKDPLSTVIPLSVTLLFITSFFSGFLSHRLCKFSPIATGLLSGGMLTAFILITALFLKGESHAAFNSGARAILHVSPIPISAFGAFLGSLKPLNKRRTTIRRR